MGRDRIIVALDVDSVEEAVALVGKLRESVCAFKIGLELVNAGGVGIFQAVREAGAKRIFYDCKFHDIPNTIAGASRAAARLGVWMFNVHCSGGSAMMRAAAEAAAESSKSSECEPPLVIGVTVLTSIDQATFNDELCTEGGIAEHVVHLAKLAKNAGLDGVVASPHEISVIRQACGEDFLIVTPGVRPAGWDVGDQKRVTTPAEAVRLGADYLVIGRPITRSSDPAKAAADIAAEIDSV